MQIDSEESISVLGLPFCNEGFPRRVPRTVGRVDPTWVEARDG